MTSSPAEAVGSLRDRLARLRARLRRITILTGTARILVAGAALLACSFLADRFLDLPIGVRRFVRLGLLDRPAELGSFVWLAALAFSTLALVATARRGLAAASVCAFVIAGVPGVLVFLGWRSLWRPLGRRPSDERLAADVEQRHEALNDRLLASLDFEGQLAHPTRGESPTFMAKTVEEAEAGARSIEFSSVASGRSALTRIAFALLAMGTLVAACVAMPELSSLWWRRSALLEEVSWPRATNLVVVMRDAAGNETERDPATPFVVSLGQTLTVTARAKGAIPDEVEILDRTERDGPSGRALAHRMRAASGRDGLFEYEFRDVRGSFSFFVRGGDDRDEIPVHHVEVRVPPHVVGLRADLEFPAYLGLPARHVDNGSFSVPEGTKIAISFESDAADARAEALIDDTPIAVETSAVKAMAGGANGPTHTFRTTAARAFRYRIRILAADGRENDPAVDAYEVAVEPDTPAKPEWVWPRGPLETTPAGRIPLFAQTRDDHGIASLTLDVDVPGTPARTFPLALRSPDAPDAANDRAYGTDSIRTYVPLEIASLTDASGKGPSALQRISVRITATDSKGQVSSGAWTPIDLLKSDEFERSFSSRRTSIKSEIEGLKADLAKTRELTAVPTTADAAADVERRGLRDVQYRLGKLRADVDRTTRSVTALFHAHVHGRIGGKAATERVLAILDQRHRTTWVQATRKPGAEAPPSSGYRDAEDEVFPYDLYRDVMQARRDRRLVDSDALDRLVAVLDAAVTTASELAPMAHEASVVAARTGAPDDVAALIVAEDRFAAGLGNVLSAMAQWQSLAELTLFVRRLIEEQEVLHGDIRNLGNGTKK